MENKQTAVECLLQYLSDFDIEIDKNIIIECILKEKEQLKDMWMHGYISNTIKGKPEDFYYHYNNKYGDKTL